jgi:hypothetical protein
MRGFKLSSFDYSPEGRGGAVGWFRGADILGRRYGFDRSTVFVEGDRYLDRWIVYVAGYTLRLHHFWRGDDDRASHTHPWWFVTFPLGGYFERIYKEGMDFDERIVAPWRFHYRPANFEHYVVEVYDPAWTIVLTGPKNSTWGFYPFEVPGTFVNWKDWK